MSNRPVTHTLRGIGLHVVLLTVGLLFMLPFVWSISTSLKPMSDLFAVRPSLIPSEIRWDNYREVFETAPFLRYYANSVIVTVARTAGQLLIASVAAFAFSQLRFPGRDLLFFILLAGLMVPDQVLIVPRFIIMRELGWFDTYQGLIVPILAQGAFGTFMFRQFFLKIPNELYEAARLDGANPWQLFWRLTLPLSRPVMTAYGVITFLTAWNIYLWPLIVVRSPEMKVVPMAIAELSGGFSQDRGVEMAAVTLSILPILALWIVGQKWFVEGVAMTGMKG